MDPVLDLEQDLTRTSLHRVPYLQYLAIVIPALIPNDRPAPEAVGGFTPVLPGPKNAKDFVGGLPGLVQGIVIDNLLPIIGAQPLGSGDQPYTPQMFLEDAGFAVAGANRTTRFKITEIDNWPAEVRHQFLTRLVSEQALRVSVASTVEGRELLRTREIPLSKEDERLVAAIQVRTSTAAKKTGGGNPVVTATTSVAHSVVNAITYIDRLFAANPPDP